MESMKNVSIGNFSIGEGEPLVVISGPCVIESEEHALNAAGTLCEIFSHFKEIHWIFKSSYDKANRSAKSSFRGPGLIKGLQILQRIKREFGIPILTDVHSAEEATIAGKVCDIIQIPAFLCRQTDLLLAAGSSGAVINIKKGQFMAPWDMSNAIDKILSAGNDKIILTERGTSFGYNNLVSDMRSIPIMQQLGFPVCFDASHSVQLPGGLKTESSGQREFIPTLSKAAIASGCNCLFIESHPDPAHAKSDKDSVFPFSALPQLLQEIIPIYEAVNRCYCRK
jgi:2-dehydro-3-deoxyphosphooctonate aldolase (KDO 8-P synthase)